MNDGATVKAIRAAILRAIKGGKSSFIPLLREMADRVEGLMPMMRFISQVDPMWLSTMRTIEKRLVEDTLVRRYEVERTNVDSLPIGEGSFSACSFWFVECLARAGQFEKARLMFEKLLGYANHLGLYSEELGAKGRHLGNFP